MKVKHLVFAIILLGLWAVLMFFVPRGTPDPANNGPEPYLIKTIDGGLREPTFAAADNKGNLWVSDSGHGRVKLFDRNGRLRGELGGPESGQQLRYPYGLGLFENKVIVADLGANALYEYTDSGRFVKAWLAPTAGSAPAGVYVGADRLVYVTDMQKGQILVFEEDGTLRTKIRPTRVSVDKPQGIAVDRDGIWVADSANYNVKQLSADGKLLNVFDGGPQLALSTAKGLAIDAKDRIYVADSLSNIIRVYNKQGVTLLSFGSSLLFPVGVSVDINDRIIVADQGHNQIKIYSLE